VGGQGQMHKGDGGQACKDGHARVGAVKQGRVCWHGHAREGTGGQVQACSHWAHKIGHACAKVAAHWWAGMQECAHNDSQARASRQTRRGGPAGLKGLALGQASKHKSGSVLVWVQKGVCGQTRMGAQGQACKGGTSAIAWVCSCGCARSFSP